MKNKNKKSSEGLKSLSASSAVSLLDLSSSYYYLYLIHVLDLQKRYAVFLSSSVDPSLVVVTHYSSLVICCLMQPH